MDILMKRITLRLILTSLLTLVCNSSALADSSDDIVVVANVSHEQATLTREQVRNLFMGASVGYHLYPVALPPQNRTRSLFNAKVIGMAESRIQSYWAQMKFTGRLTPPEEVRNEREMLAYLTHNKGSIGYLTADTELPENLVVLFSTD